MREEIVAIVRESGGEMHWTVVLDRALQRGVVPPSPDARKLVLSALADAADAGEIVKTSTGTYRDA